MGKCSLGLPSWNKDFIIIIIIIIIKHFIFVPKNPISFTKSQLLYPQKMAMYLNVK